MKKILIALLLSTIAFTGCTEAQRVSSNISKEAGNFNVTRRLVAINTRSDKLLFEVIGNFW